MKSSFPSTHLLKVTPKVKSRFSRIFQLASKFTKYYVLALFSFFLVCLFASIFDLSALIAPLMPFLLEWFLRFAAFTLCFVVLAVVIESFRQ
jgi:hypothetical protein